MYIKGLVSLIFLCGRCGSGQEIGNSSIIVIPRIIDVTPFLAKGLELEYPFTLQINEIGFLGPGARLL